MTSPDPAPTTQATFAIGDERAANRVVDAITESYPHHDLAIAAFEAPGGRWDVTMHFAEPPDEALIRALVTQAAGEAAAGAIVFSTVETKDWVRASLADLVPVHAGRYVVHGSHDRGRVPANRIAIEIEAALAFGTGHHGTTRGCLEALDRLAKESRPGRPRRILDVGTGSGVLAIAAARRFRRSVLASDIDVQAVAAARDNARLNRAGDLVTTVAAKDLAPHLFRGRAPYDLVLANILLPTLKLLAGPAVRLMAPGGQIVLSGLLTTHAAAAVAAYRARGLVFERRIVREGWVTLVMRRPAVKSQRPGPGIQGARQ